MTKTFSLRKTLRMFTVAVPLAAIGLTACSPDVMPRGNLPPAASLAQVEPGESSRQQVLSLLGSPSSTSLFGEQEVWYYIGAQTTQYAIYPTRELSRQVITVRFDRSGIVEDMTVLNREDGTEVVLADRTTPSASRDLNVIQEILGNVGRFTPSSQ